MTLSRRDFLQMLGGAVGHTVLVRVKPPKPPRRRTISVIVAARSGISRAGGIRASITGNVIPLPPGTQVWPVSLKTGA